MTNLELVGADGERVVKRYPEPIRVPSDDLSLTFGGEEYTPHAGEYIKVQPGLLVGAMELIGRLHALQPEIEAIDATTPLDEAVEIQARMAGVVTDMAKLVAPRIIDWTWTDRAGNRRPAPADDPTVLRTLEVRELMYLLNVLRSETDTAQGKG